MQKNTKGQLVLIFVLLGCAVALFGAALAVAFSDRDNNGTPNNSIVDSTDDSEWTKNY